MNFQTDKKSHIYKNGKNIMHKRLCWLSLEDDTGDDTGTSTLVFIFQTTPRRMSLKE